MSPNSSICISIPFVFCTRSRPTNKRNGEQKHITKDLIKRTGWETHQISKGANKAALSYVEQTVTVHIVCFTCEPECFYWLVVHEYAFQYLLCFGQGQRPTNKRNGEQKHETGQFHNQSRFINCGEIFRSILSTLQSILCNLLPHNGAEGLAQWLRYLPPNPEPRTQFDLRSGRRLNIWVTFFPANFPSL